MLELTLVNSTYALDAGLPIVTIHLNIFGYGLLYQVNKHF